MSARKECAVNGFRPAGQNYLAFLQRIIALVSSFATLAERVAAAPAPIRGPGLWALRRAEAIVRRITARAAVEIGMYLDQDLLVFVPDGAGPEAAICLADQFLLLAETLQTIFLCLSGWMHQAAPADGQDWPACLVKRNSRRPFMDARCRRVRQRQTLPPP